MKKPDTRYVVVRQSDKKYLQLHWPVPDSNNLVARYPAERWVAKDEASRFCWQDAIDISKGNDDYRCEEMVT